MVITYTITVITSIVETTVYPFDSTSTPNDNINQYFGSPTLDGIAKFTWKDYLPVNKVSDPGRLVNIYPGNYVYFRYKSEGIWSSFRFIGLQPNNQSTTL